MTDESSSSSREPVPTGGSVLAGPAPSKRGSGTDAGADASDTDHDAGSPSLRSLDPEDSEACIRGLGDILTELTRRFGDLGRGGGGGDGRHGRDSGGDGRDGRRRDRR